jgi:hypothetical protein
VLEGSVAPRSCFHPSYHQWQEVAELGLRAGRCEPVTPMADPVGHPAHLAGMPGGAHLEAKVHRLGWEGHLWADP